MLQFIPHDVSFMFVFCRTLFLRIFMVFYLFVFMTGRSSTGIRQTHTQLFYFKQGLTAFALVGGFAMVDVAGLSDDDGFQPIADPPPS